MSERPIRTPWVGEDFHKSLLMIVGHSHYWSPDRAFDPMLTVETVSGVVNNGDRLPFYTAIEAAVTDCDAWATDPAAFWPTVAFANFCQGATASAEDTPTKEMWAAGVRAFPPVLNNVHPRRLLVFSTMVWNHLSKLEDMTWHGEPPIEHNGKQLEVGYLSTNDGSLRVLSMGLPHPAARTWGTSRDWHPSIKAFLDRPLRST